MEWMEEEEETLDYNADEYLPEELNKCIEELAGKKTLAVTTPSIAEENGETLPELGANSSGATGAEFSISRSKWEQLQRTVKRL